MEATGNQNVDLNSQFRTIVVTTPPVKQKFYPLPTPIAFTNRVLYKIQPLNPPVQGCSANILPVKLSYCGLIA